jgi:hypothetical protein
MAENAPTRPASTRAEVGGGQCAAAGSERGGNAEQKGSGVKGKPTSPFKKSVVKLM